ncbi:hypothetical protein Ae505Ps2_2547 [Pseudonocardia sp. Ae505_Ps2]|nr:hypothetical protein Ae505Ps2_2547 [Pseudonocardia sp. Ae505_Ps2]
MANGDGAGAESAFFSYASMISTGIQPRSAIRYPFWRAHERIALLCWCRPVDVEVDTVRARRGRAAPLGARRAAGRASHLGALGDRARADATYASCCSDAADDRRRGVARR